MKRAGVIVLLPALAIVLAAVLAWLSSPWWIARLVSVRIADSGFEVVAFDMTPPGSSALHVGRLSMRDPATGMTMTVDDVAITYRPRELVLGRIGAIGVGRAELVMPRGGGLEQDRARALALPATLPELPWRDWLPMMPAQGLTVHELVVRSSHDLPVLPPLSIRLTGDGDTALLMARPLDAAAADRVVELVVDLAGNVNGALTYPDPRRGAALEFGFSSGHRDEAQWILQMASNIGELEQWLAPIHPVSWPISGCTAVAHLKLGENPLDALAADITLADCHSSQLHFAEASASGRFMRTARGMASIAPASVSIRDWSLPPFEGGSLTLDSGIDMDFEAAALNLPVGATLRFADVTVEDLRIATGEVTLAESLPLQAGAAGAAVLDAADVVIERQGDSANVSSARIELPLVAGVPQSMRVVTPEIVLESAEYRASVADGVIDVSWVDGRLDGSARGQLGGVMPLEATLAANITSGSGSVRLEGGPVTLGDQVGSAARLLQSGWPAGVDLVSGGLGFVVDGRWDPASLEATARVLLDGVGGVVDGVYFSDAVSELDLTLYPEFATRTAAATTIAVVDYGISLNDVKARIEIDGFTDDLPLIVARDLSARVFGGTLRVPRLTTAINEEFDLEIDNLELADMVGGDQFPGLRMGGRVGGRVPMEVRHDGLYIRTGSIENIGDGIIQYDAGDLSGGQADIVFRALKDFQYTVLRAEPVYSPDGTLVLQVHLQGTSEEFGRDRPVHFNINVEQNLLSLLESIRLVNGLNDRIDRDVNQYYEQRQTR